MFLVGKIAEATDKVLGTIHDGGVWWANNSRMSSMTNDGQVSPQNDEQWYQ